MIGLSMDLTTYNEKTNLFTKTLINISKDDFYISNKKTTFINI